MMKTKLVCALALAAMGGVAQAKGIPSDLTFDGYCDGLTGLTLSGPTATGQWANYDCAGSAAAVGGGATKKLYYLSTDLSFVLGFTISNDVKSDGTWVIYMVDGSVLNSGTYTAGAPGLRAQGGKASTSK